MSTDFTTLRASTATEIADEFRDRIERGELAAGVALPPVRALADMLGVNRNTVVAAYKQLATTGLVQSRGRTGTIVRELARPPQEGFAADSVLLDVGSGNPDPAHIPDLAPALAAVAGRPVLYGEPVIDAELLTWATDWFRADFPDLSPTLSVTNGAVDAIERLLTGTLVRDDAVALEDPCFLASSHTVRLGGYRAVPVPVDAEGMTVAGLRAALADGVRAVILTPRAQNPTGVSLSAARATDLRAVLADYPYVLIIEDDHFSMLATSRPESVIAPAHERYAVVRSVSKFLGPDMSLAVTATDAFTARRLGLRLSPGTTWVSHLLQRIAVAQLTDDAALAHIATARTFYADRNAHAAEVLQRAGFDVQPTDGLSLWVGLGADTQAISARLMRRGWLARTGNEFQLTEHSPGAEHLRLTVHHLSDAQVTQLAEDLRAAVAEA